MKCLCYLSSNQIFNFMRKKFNAIVDTHCERIKFIKQLRFVVDKQCGLVSIRNDLFFATRLIPLCCLVIHKLRSAHNDTQNCGTNDHKLSEQFLIVYLGKLHQESISRRETDCVVHCKNVWWGLDASLTNKRSIAWIHSEHNRSCDTCRTVTSLYLRTQCFYQYLSNSSI